MRMGMQASTEMTPHPVLMQGMWKMYMQGTKASCIVAEGIGLGHGLMHKKNRHGITVNRKGTNLGRYV